MPALAYTARPSPPPPLIYCDSSFLFDLFGAADPVRLAKYPTGVRTRAADATAFFTWARQQGGVFVTSLLALEEIHRVIVFTPINTELRKKRKAKGISTWKELRAKKAVVFQQKLDDGRNMLGVFQKFFTALKIPLVMFGRPRLPSEDLAARRISVYARVLLVRFVLDGMDAYHIAVARFCGIHWAATSDADWGPIPTITSIGAA